MAESLSPPHDNRAMPQRARCMALPRLRLRDVRNRSKLNVAVFPNIAQFSSSQSSP
uniref:Uncharacterized protein n=1 Tax=Hyaloperonospora arabidopsidis (strain Emoy2) TaxID=559515 RepID=M4B696_HYAAE